MQPAPLLWSAASAFRLAAAVSIPDVRDVKTETVADPLERRAIERIRQGDPSAYDYLVEKYMRRVLSIAWGIVRNATDAEELTQRAFVRAWEKLDRFHESEPFGPWVYRIVTNLALDLVKHRKRVPHEELSADRRAGRRDDADVPAVANEIARRIDAAIESLPEMQRIVVRLVLVEEMDQRAVASMTGLSEGTIRSHLSLGRKKLREMLYDLYGDQR